MQLHIGNESDHNQQILEAAGWKVVIISEAHFFAYHSQTGRILEHIIGSHEDSDDDDKYVAIQFKLAFKEILASLKEQTKEPLPFDALSTGWDVWDKA
jgi:beta-lactamase superfamily II metal-dependent hydrolase